MKDFKKVKLTSKEKTEKILAMSKEELQQFGWATISSRVQEYVELLKAYNDNYTILYNRIRLTYGRNTDSVFAGVIAYIRYGIDFYYSQFLEGRVK